MLTPFVLLLEMKKRTFAPKQDWPGGEIHTGKTA
jgi:hypothetical protein